MLPKFINKSDIVELKVPVIKTGIDKLNMQTSNDIITIAKLVKNIESGLWDTDPEYQRGYNWKPKNKNELVTSLLKGVPLPLIYLRAKGDVFEVLDGKQRSLTIYNFVKNKFAYNMGNGKLLFFRNLPKSEQQDILDTSISVRFLMNASDSDAIDIFIALQNGQRMRTEEIRHSLGGNAIDTIKEIIDQTDFMKCHAFCRGSDYTKYETIMTKFLYFEHIIIGSITSDIMNDNSLYNMVKAYTTQKVDTKLKQVVIDRIKILTNAYKDSKNVLMPQLPMLYCSYLLAAKLQDQKTLTNLEIADKLYAFSEYVKDLRTDYIDAIKDYDHQKKYTDEEHKWYKMTMENFGKRGTAKCEVHIYTEWFQDVWNQFITKFPLKRKKLSLFNS